MLDEKSKQNCLAMQKNIRQRVRWLLAFLFLAPALFGCGENVELLERQCKIYSDAYSCENTCVQSDGENKITREFKVSQKEKSVLSIRLRNGVQDDSSIFKGCTIFDDKNWDCSEEKSLDSYIKKETNRMSNGIYTHLVNETLGLINENRTSATCAKKANNK